MCRYCTTEDCTEGTILKDGYDEYRGESCQLYYFDKIPFLCFFTRQFGSKHSHVKINYCPWCGDKLDKNR